MKTRLQHLLVFTFLTIALPLGVFAQGEELSVSIVNASGVDICAIAAGLSGTEEWNPNILAEPLKPGDSFVISGFPPGAYHLIARDCAGAVVDASYDNVFESGAHVW